MSSENFRHNVNEQTADEIGLSASPCCGFDSSPTRCSVLDRYHGRAIVSDKVTGENLSSKYRIQFVDTELGFFVYATDELDHEKRVLKMVQNVNLQISYVTR